jgi:hypothetical protein
VALLHLGCGQLQRQLVVHVSKAEENGGELHRTGQSKGKHVARPSLSLSSRDLLTGSYHLRII